MFKLGKSGLSIEIKEADVALGLKTLFDLNRICTKEHNVMVGLCQHNPRRV